MTEMIKTDLGGASPPALWDRVVRVSHWGIAAVVFGNEVITRGGSAAHVWIGWVGMILLVVRLIWGVTGPREARFSAFPPDPKAAVGHTRDLLAGRPRLYGSHNPAGAIMVYALWASMAVMTATGFYMSGPNPFGAAQQEAAVNSDDWSTLGTTDSESSAGDLVKMVHGTVANLILLLVSLHVGGVFIEGLVMRRNLILPMVFGDRKSGIAGSVTERNDSNA